MKITDETTLGQLAIRRMQLGIDTINVIPGAKGIDRTAFVHHVTEGTFIGNGKTEAEAIDQAFARVEDRIGTKIHREQKREGGPAIEIVESDTDELRKKGA